jgi:hypothetical protein
MFYADIRNVTIQCNDIEGNEYDQILSREQWEAEIKTIYKRKA